MTIDEMNRIRKEIGLTYQDLCTRSGIPISTIQKIFGGVTKNPRIATVQKIEQVLLAAIEESERDPGSRAHYMEKDSGSESSYMKNPDRDESVLSVNEPGFRYGSDGTSAVKLPDYYTIEQREALPDDRRTELLDGVLYDMASPTLNHQRTVREFYDQFHDCIREHASGCELFFAPADVVLPGKHDTVVVPDLFIVCDESRTRHSKVYGAPDFVLEVLSPSTAHMDKYRKLVKYGGSGVREYWIVDIPREKVYVYRFDEKEDDSDKAKNMPAEFPDYDVETFTFSDRIPVGISKGQCEIDMNRIAKRLKPEE